jgi:hypothetical protein
VQGRRGHAVCSAVTDAVSEAHASRPPVGRFVHVQVAANHQGVRLVGPGLLIVGSFVVMAYSS